MKTVIRSLPVAFLAAVLIAAAASFVSRDLPTKTSTLFAGSGVCATCHSSSEAALIDAAGNDVSPPSDWRASLMANAARDPLWLAKVSTEIEANPALQSIIEDKCTTCHAPMGRTQAIYDGAAGYTMEELLQDPMAMDGISCAACHQIRDEDLGEPESFSGNYVIGDTREIFGPYENPLAGPMQMVSGFLPVFGEHMGESEMCAVCHTLFTPFVDNDGQVAGELPEQTAYLEWENSEYEEQDIECQDCHMPELEESVVLSSIPPASPPRSPFSQHHFVGGNTTMLRLMRANIDAVGVTADEVHFDSTIARTERLLQSASADLYTDTSVEGDTLRLLVAVINQTGHKFPTGFPSRRVWLRVKVFDSENNVVFESGSWDDEGRIIGVDGFEPHHDIIRRQDQVQIYQSVMVDVDGEVTWTLLRGADYIKDNRIPPSGFTSEHPNYEHTAIKGAAANDGNFNRFIPGEGTGLDEVHYRIGGLPSGSDYRAEVSLVYQGLAPEFLDDLFTYETADVATFRGMWDDTDKSPFVMKTVEVQWTATAIRRDEIPAQLSLTAVYPNPFRERTTFSLILARPGPVDIDIWDVRGRLVLPVKSGYLSSGEHLFSWDGTDGSGSSAAPGLYWIRAVGPSGSATIPVTRR
jgi:hypothetical protein